MFELCCIHNPHAPLNLFIKYLILYNSGEIVTTFCCGLLRDGCFTFALYVYKIERKNLFVSLKERGFS